MMSKTPIRYFLRSWTAPEDAWYALLDGAVIPQLPGLLQQYDLPCACLYAGALTPDLAQVAPYLVRLDGHEDFLSFYDSCGWAPHWGVFFSAPADLRQMRRHCRRFLMVMGPEQQPLYLRYYDPRVLPGFLETCDRTQLKEFFGPITGFFIDQAPNGGILKLSLHEGRLLSAGSSALASVSPVATTGPSQFVEHDYAEA